MQPDPISRIPELPLTGAHTVTARPSMGARRDSVRAMLPWMNVAGPARGNVLVAISQACSGRTMSATAANLVDYVTPSHRSFRRYRVVIHPPVRVGKGDSPEVVADAAQSIADRITELVRAHPTQWIDF